MMTASLARWLRRLAIRLSCATDLERQSGVRLIRGPLDIQQLCSLPACPGTEDAELARRLLALLYTDARGHKLLPDRLAGLDDAACEALLCHFVENSVAHCGGADWFPSAGPADRTVDDLARRIVAHILAWEHATIQLHREFARSGLAA